MTINNKFNISQIVYLKTEEEQREYMVTEITVASAGVLSYQLSSGTMMSSHWEIEISASKDQVKKFNN